MDARHWGETGLVAGRGLVARAEPSSQAALALAEAWDDLCRGKVRITREYSNVEGHHVELAPADGRGPTSHELDLLTPVLLGKLQKVVALNALRSPSSVATVAAGGLRSLGLECRPRDTPLVVVMMAQAWHQLSGSWAPVEAGVSQLSTGGALLSVTRPDAWLDGVLSPCERRVLRRRVDGLSHEDVARQCEISIRTVANQIASGYRKLGVSGRLELLNCVLAPRGFTPPRRPPPRAPSGLRPVAAAKAP